MATIQCPKHGETEGINRKDGSLRCGKCASSWVVRSRRNKKERLVKLFGGKCTQCGYEKYMGALDFHHLDPSQKLFSLSVKGLCYSWKTILKEAKKCQLLCKNCHAEVEASKHQLLPGRLGSAHTEAAAG